MHTLLQPWSHPFMQRALLELVFVGVVGAVLGCWIVLYELAYSAESLAHALFPGLVAAALLGLPLLLGAAGGVLAAAAGVALAGRLPGIGPAATARELARRVPTMMLAATGVAVGCALAGLYVSYYADIAAGASVAGTTVVAYLALGLAQRGASATKSPPSAS